VREHTPKVKVSGGSHMGTTTIASNKPLGWRTSVSSWVERSIRFARRANGEEFGPPAGHCPTGGHCRRSVLRQASLVCTVGQKLAVGSDPGPPSHGKIHGIWVSAGRFQCSPFSSVSTDSSRRSRSQDSWPEKISKELHEWTVLSVSLPERWEFIRLEVRYVAQCAREVGLNAEGYRTPVGERFQRSVIRGED